MALSIDRSSVLLIQQKDDLTPRLGQCGPSCCTNRRIQSGCSAAHVIWSDHLVGLEDRTNLCIECIKDRRRKYIPTRSIGHLPGHSLFGFHENKNRQSVWM